MQSNSRDSVSFSLIPDWRYAVPEWVNGESSTRGELTITVAQVHDDADTTSAAVARGGADTTSGEHVFGGADIISSGIRLYYMSFNNNATIDTRRSMSLQHIHRYILLFNLLKLPLLLFFWKFFAKTSMDPSRR
jgi:hypothetical protein